MPVINHFLIMGDSLSDRGAMNHRKLFNILPMSVLSGLSGKSSTGRFTDGYTWADQVLCGMIAGFELQKDPTKTPEQIKEAIANDTDEAKAAYKKVDLNNDGFVFSEDTIFARTYCEGGLTAYSWAGSPSYNPVRFISRFILSTLEEKLENSIMDDQLGPFLDEQKAKTLVIEWSGANDLITANAEPSEAIADLAIAARVQNIEEMIRNGYRNFALFNLPDLSLTPRYQRLSQKDRDNAHSCCEYFNTKLAEACERLKTQYPDCSIEVFDISSIFTETYNEAKAGNNEFFEASKLGVPLTETKDCKIEEDGTCPAKGYMFWDDVHPTKQVHKILATKFYEKFGALHTFPEPELPNIKTDQELRQEFARHYVERLQFDGTGGFTNSRLNLYKHNNEILTLEEILEHALFEGGDRSLEVITELGWLDAKRNVNYMQPALHKAMVSLQKKRLGITESQESADELVAKFEASYEEEISTLFFFKEKRSRLDRQDLILENILAHAFHNNGNRTLSIMRRLGWFDEKNNVILKNEALKQAICNFQRERINQEQKAFCDQQDQNFIVEFKAVCESYGIDIDINTEDVSEAIKAIKEKVESIFTFTKPEPAQATMDIDSLDLNETIADTTSPLYKALLNQGWINTDGQLLNSSLAPTITTQINNSELRLSQ